MTPILLLAFAALGFSGAAHAGEGLAVSPMPFSRDGKYFAFEQYGTPGGVGYSEIQIIDVAANRPKDAPIVADMNSLKKSAESEGREELDLFIDAMRAIAREARETPELVKGAPHHTRIGRLDEAAAARRPVLRWKK